MAQISFQTTPLTGAQLSGVRGEVVGNFVIPKYVIGRGSCPPAQITTVREPNGRQRSPLPRYPVRIHSD